MADDLRKRDARPGPRTGQGDGAAYRTGYGADGLGSGADREGAREPNSWDAPGVDPEGERTGSSTEGPRMAVDEEASPDPDAETGPEPPSTSSSPP